MLDPSSKTLSAGGRAEIYAGRTRSKLETAGTRFRISNNRARQHTRTRANRCTRADARVPVYVALGDKEKVLDALEKSYQDQLKIDQRYDSLHNEPRFQAILKKVELRDVDRN